LLLIADEPTLAAEGVINHYFFWRPAQWTARSRPGNSRLLSTTSLAGSLVVAYH
jgi:hypothetical protein